MSSAFESNRMVTSAPNGAETNPFLAGASPGGGVQEEQQGQVNIKARVSYAMLTRMFQDAQGSGRKTIYPCPSPGVQNVKNNELAWTVPPTEEELVKNPELLGEQGFPDIATALNGIGRSAVSELPEGDEKGWSEWITHTIKALGPIVGGVQTAGLESPFVTVQINGLTTHYAEETVPAGYLVRYVARPQSELERNQSLHRPNEIMSKVTLGYEPFRPSTLSDVMRTHVRLFLTNKVNYQKAFNMGYRKTRSLVSSMEHLFTFSKMTFLGLLDELIRTGNMFAELRGDYNMFAGGQHPNVLNGAPERHTFICALAKGMGLLPEHTVPGAFFGMQQANRWDNLTRQALMKVLVPHEYQQLSLGYDDGTGLDVGVDINTGVPVRGTAIGELTWTQFQAPNLFYAHISDSFSRLQAQITGLCVKGSTQGSTFVQHYRPT